MKLQIKKIKQAYQPKTFNDITSYSYWCEVQVGDREFEAMVKAYKKDFIKEATFETGVNCKSIDKKELTSNKTGDKFDLYTIKVIPKEKKMNNTFPKLNMEQLLYAVAESEKTVNEKDFITDKQTAFFEMLNIIADHVNYDCLTEKDKDLADMIKEEVSGEEVKPDFDDDNIPF